MTYYLDYLRFTAVTTAGLFAGGALYINLVEQPSRSELPAKYQHQQWKKSFQKAAVRMPTLGVISSLASTAVFFMDDVTALDQVKWWLAAPVSFILGGLWTVTFMLPDIKILLDDSVVEKKGESWVKTAIANWTFRHGMRTLLDASIFCSSVCLVMFRRTAA